MIGFLLGAVLIGASVAGAIGSSVFIYRTYNDETYGGDRHDWAGVTIGSMFLGLSLICLLFFAGLATGEFHFEEVADGCYRITTTHSTGTTSDGKVIQMSGKNYEPIRCP